MMTPLEEKEQLEEIRENAGRSAADRVSRALNMLLTAALIAALGAVVYVTVSAARGRIVSVFGRSVLVVVTGSMEPSIHTGDYIFIERVSPQELEEQDIIAFYSEQQDIFGMLVTHRIVKKNGDGSFVTKGDANPVEDSVTVRPERIVGRYTGKARFFRWASSFGEPRKLIAVFVMIPTAIGAVYEVVTVARLGRQIAREKKAAVEKREKEIREAIEREKKRLAEEGFGKESPEDDTGKEEDDGSGKADEEQDG